MSELRKGADGLPVRSAPVAALLPFTDDPRPASRGTADEFRPGDDDRDDESPAGGYTWDNLPDWIADIEVELPRPTVPILRQGVR